MPPSMEATHSAAKKKTSKTKAAAQKKTAIARRAPEKASDLVPARGAAQKGLKRALTSTKKVVSDHPVASVGTLLGAGVLVGVAARAMRRNPSIGDAVAEAISSRATKATKSLAKSARSQIKKASSSVRRALK